QPLLCVEPVLSRELPVDVQVMRIDHQGYDPGVAVALGQRVLGRPAVWSHRVGQPGPAFAQCARSIAEPAEKTGQHLPGTTLHARNHRLESSWHLLPWLAE